MALRTPCVALCRMQYICTKGNSMTQDREERACLVVVDVPRRGSILVPYGRRPARFADGALNLQRYSQLSTA